MAKVRVKDIASVTSNANDDMLMTDGTTNGTKSINVNDFLKQVPVSDIGGIDYSSEQGHEGLEVKLDGTTLTNGEYGLSVTTPIPSMSGVDDGQVLTKTTTSGGPSLTWAPQTTIQVDGSTILNTSGTLSVNYGDGLDVESQQLVVSNPLPSSYTLGDILTIESKNGTDSIVWDSLQNVLTKESPTSHVSKTFVLNDAGTLGWSDPVDLLPTITSGDSGKVLAVNAQENGVEWVPASGGGGGSGLTTLYYEQNGIKADPNDEDEMTVSEVLAAYDASNGNLQVIANSPDLDDPMILRPTQKTNSYIQFIGERYNGIDDNIYCFIIDSGYPGTTLFFPTARIMEISSEGS